MLDRNYSFTEYFGMTLAEYLAETGVTEAELARTTGLSQPTINRIRNGVGNPTADVLRRIEQATQGSVPAAAFFGRSDQIGSGDAVRADLPRPSAEAAE